MKTISNCLIITVLALALMSCDKEIYDNNDGKIQLLERIIYPDPDFLLSAKSLTQCQIVNAVKYEKYEYDNQNRITKILRYNRSETVVGTQTFTYNGNDLVKVVHEGGPCGPDVETWEFARNGNKITITINGGYLSYMGTRTFTFELTEDEFPTNFRSLDDWSWSPGETHNQYQDGNLIKRIGSGSQNYSITFEYDENKSPFYNSQTPRGYIANDNPTKVFAIEINGETVGSIGIFPQSDLHKKSAEIGYWLAEEYWGQGIIPKAIEEIVEYGFQTFDIVRIYARPFSTNLKSQRVLEKAGFVFEARLKKAIFKNGEFMDELIYTKLNQ